MPAKATQEAIQRTEVDHTAHVTSYGGVMDPLSSAALFVVVTSAILYALYWVIRRAVAAGIRDAEDRP